ncbi:hypothetical protein Bbelb_243520 [Branchiostoma belcheri]|nr:hypothetical protein Bbelb_243520 [Branchiostoma belcheri]
MADGAELREAAGRGEEDRVKQLLAEGVNVNAADGSEYTALHKASENGHTGTVQALLTAGAAVNARNNLRRTALHHASRYGHTGTVQALLTAGATINARNNSPAPSPAPLPPPSSRAVIAAPPIAIRIPNHRQIRPANREKQLLTEMFRTIVKPPRGRISPSPEDKKTAEDLGVQEDVQQEFLLFKGKTSGQTKHLNTLQPKVVDDLLTIYLNDKGLTSVPAEVFDIRDVECLVLSNNRLKSIPEEIGQLQKLQRLELDNNLLTQLPQAITTLPNLQYIDLSHNKLETLPDGLSKLKQLQYLNIWNNVFKEIPEEVCSLLQLQILSVVGNPLKCLPDKISQLTGLTRLDIDNCQFDEFPRQVLQLEGLKTLYMGNWAGEGKPSLVPEDISRLKNLELLDLRNSGLESLPDGVGELVKLNMLNISDNRFTSVPEQIMNLSNIRKLLLSGNSISRLPLTLGHLDKLDDMDIRNNPLTYPPPDVCEKGTATVMDFLRTELKKKEDKELRKLFSRFSQNVTETHEVEDLAGALGLSADELSTIQASKTQTARSQANKVLLKWMETDSEASMDKLQQELSDFGMDYLAQEAGRVKTQPVQRPADTSGGPPAKRKAAGGSSGEGHQEDQLAQLMEENQSLKALVEKLQGSQKSTSQDGAEQPGDEIVLIHVGDYNDKLVQPLLKQLVQSSSRYGVTVSEDVIEPGEIITDKLLHHLQQNVRMVVPIITPQTVHSRYWSTRGYKFCVQNKNLVFSVFAYPEGTRERLLEVLGRSCAGMLDMASAEVPMTEEKMSSTKISLTATQILRKASSSVVLYTQNITPAGCTVEEDGVTMFFPKGCVKKKRLMSLEVDMLPIDGTMANSFSAVTPVMTVHLDTEEDFLKPVTVTLPWTWKSTCDLGRTILMKRTSDHWSTLSTEVRETKDTITFTTCHFCSVVGAKKKDSAAEDSSTGTGTEQQDEAANQEETKAIEVLLTRYSDDKVHLIISPNEATTDDKRIHLLCIEKGKKVTEFFTADNFKIPPPFRQEVTMHNKETICVRFDEEEDVIGHPRDIPPESGIQFAFPPANCNRITVRLELQDPQIGKGKFEGAVHFTLMSEAGEPVRDPIRRINSAHVYLHSLQEVTSVLMVNDNYGTSHGGRSTTNRQVALFLQQHGATVHATAVQASEEDKRCANEDGIHLILPAIEPGDPRTPCLEMLTFDHESRYPDIPRNLNCIVGHSDVTCKAAKRIKRDCCKEAKLVLFNHDIPEETEQFKGTKKAMAAGKKMEDILKDTKNADAVFSLGRRIFDHFEAKYKSLGESKPKEHLMFLPRPSPVFKDISVQPGGGEKVVLAVGRVTEVDKLKGHDLVARSMGEVAKITNVSLRVRGIDEDDYEASNRILEENLHSGKIKPTLLPCGTQEDIADDMKQAHLVLMPSRAEPFGLIGLEAIAAGIPVLISDKSGLADMIMDLIEEEKCPADMRHRIVETSVNESDLSEDARKWAEKIVDTLKFSKSEFEKAAEYKKKLLESKYWEESHQNLLRVCGLND